MLSGFGFLPPEELQFGADESPRVPRLAFHNLAEQVNGGGVVVMIKTPVPNTITHRIEGEFSFEILRPGRRRRQNSLLRKFSLIEMQKAQIKSQVWFGVFYLWRNTCQNLRGLLIFAGPPQ